jgi:hypothetical protein
VTVQNQGWGVQTTNLVVRLNTTILGNVTNLILPPVSQMTLIFTWQTSPALRGSYALDSLLNSVPNEPDTTDNNRTYARTIRVTVVGDVNADGVVDIFDAITLANAFASVPASQNWNGNADINGDNYIDIFDAILLSTNFNKKV